jgi:hypothetical protein
MNRTSRQVCILLFGVACTAGCDKAKDTPPAPAPTASATVAAVASTTPPPSSAPTPSATASSAGSEAAKKDAAVTVKDPASEPQKTVKAIVGGSVALYLPQWPGTKWSTMSNDKALGKPKEEVLPGFLGSTPAIMFTWPTTSAELKAGQKKTIQLVNKKAKPDGPPKPETPFSLTIEFE